MFICEICKKEFVSLQALSNHLCHSHKINSKETKQLYYDTYMKKEPEGHCLLCNKLTHFQSLNR